MKSIFPCLVFLVLVSCKKIQDATPVKYINFIFRFDSTQVRLNNIGQPSVIPAGHAAQSPVFNKMTAHYLELAPNDNTPLGGGSVLYHAPETTLGGERAIDFSRSTMAGNDEVFLKVRLDSLLPGTYKWLRVSLAYQNYDIKFNYGTFSNLNATIASFIGYKTYLQQYRIKDSLVTVNANRKQGYWAFETSVSGVGYVSSGQAPDGATTVPNPIFATSPIPAGSCVVTGQFAQPLVITGNETGDINVRVALSTNKSFEWVDNNNNGAFEPNVDNVVDMGIRGLIPSRLN